MKALLGVVDIWSTVGVSSAVPRFRNFFCREHFRSLKLFLFFKAELKAEFRDKFYNITQIMDCVACDKCKLWGKLQVSGMGTALKVLLADLRVKSCKPSQLHIHISRNEIVALFNAFGRISTSIRQLKNFPNLMD